MIVDRYFAKAPTPDYFSDIQDKDRRIKMAKKFKQVVSKDADYFASEIAKCALDDLYDGIRHCRCWLVELLAYQLELSQSQMDNQIIRDPAFIRSISGGIVGCPVRDVSLKFKAIMEPSRIAINAGYIAKHFWNPISEVHIDVDLLAERLLRERVANAIKLKGFNPLYVVIDSIFVKNGYSVKTAHMPSLLSDIQKSKAGRFSVRIAEKASRKIVYNSLSCQGGNDDHKSKEWGGRCRMMRYRIENDEVITAPEDVEFIFVPDGLWTGKALKRMASAGWKILQLEDLAEEIS